MGKMPFIAQLQAGMEAAKAFTTSLFSFTSGAILELEETKTDKWAATPITIPASGWKLSEGQGAEPSSETYPYYFDIEDENVTTLDRAEVTFSVGSLPEATSCGLCPTCETVNGRIRLWSSSKPEANITAEYWIEQGTSPKERKE